MNRLNCLLLTACGLMCLHACSSDDDSPPAQSSHESTTEDADAGAAVSDDAKRALDLHDISQHPDAYDWFDFKPNVEKLILAGDANSEHIAVLWYTVADGGVALHYHAKTESVYVIDGTQTDAKGTYPTGTAYFNPPGSGHEVRDSSGFFLLAYAAPPDFMSTDRIGEYTPVVIDTTDPELASHYDFDEPQPGTKTYAVPLDHDGGMSAELMMISADESYSYRGNYLTVLRGSCEIDGMTRAEEQLVVTRDVTPAPFEIAASEGASCLALGVSF